MSETPKLLTVKQFSEHHPAFSQAALRSLIFQAASREASNGVIPGNGLDVAIIRLGRKVLIDETKFFSWITAQGGNRD